MATKIRHLLERDGRFFARIVIPKNLRLYLDNKTELRAPLGPDRKRAERDIYQAVTILQQRIRVAELKAETEAGGSTSIGARFPLSNEEIARISYKARLAQDEDARNTTRGYALMGINDQFVAELRLGMAGKLNNFELDELVGHRIAHFVKAGNTTVTLGTSEWRSLARLICQSEYEALERIYERDNGSFDGQPTLQFLKVSEEPSIGQEPEAPPLPLPKLFNDYIESRGRVGKGAGAAKRWKPVISDLVKFIGHKDARKLTKADLLRWRDAKLQTLAPKTVSSVNLACIRTILQWALENDMLDVNVAAHVRQEVSRKIRNREKGYTDDEATKIVRSSIEYRPADPIGRRKPEPATRTAVKRWVPLLCAFTGARVVEITQLRKHDVRYEKEPLILRIKPEAGTVKIGLYRDVPVHPQLVALGFDRFVENASGAFFYEEHPSRDALRAAQSAAAIVGRWLAANDLKVAQVAPNHGWRHRFKTVGREVGIEDRVLDALTGHSARTAGDDYGDVTIETKIWAIERFPHYKTDKHDANITLPECNGKSHAI